MKSRARNEWRTNHGKKQTVLFGAQSGKCMLDLSKSNPSASNHTHKYPEGVFVCAGNACANKKKTKTPIKGLCWGEGFLLHYMCSQCFEAEVTEDKRKSWLLFAEPLFLAPPRSILAPLSAGMRFSSTRPLTYDGDYLFDTKVLPRSGMPVSPEGSAGELTSAQQVPSADSAADSADTHVVMNEAFEGFGSGYGGP